MLLMQLLTKTLLQVYKQVNLRFWSTNMVYNRIQNSGVGVEVLLQTPCFCLYVTQLLKLFFLTFQPLFLIAKELKQRRKRRLRESRKKKINKKQQIHLTTTTLHVNHTFWYMSLHDYDLKRPHSTFYGGPNYKPTSCSLSFLTSSLQQY